MLFVQNLLKLSSSPKTTMQLTSFQSNSLNWLYLGIGVGGICNHAHFPIVQ